MDKSLKLKKSLWEAPVEENQWGILQNMRTWNSELEFGEQPPENATIYIRVDPAPAAVKVYDGGTGEENEFLEEPYNDMADKPFDPGKQPFLFSSIEKRGPYVKLGKLDDESKAMLKERYGVDTDG